jgi:hypothetical protein
MTLTSTPVTQVAANVHFPPGALGWRSFAKLLRAVNASGIWCLDVVNQSPAEAVQVLAELQQEQAGAGQLEVELGNELYDFHAFLPLFPNASAYLQWVAPLLAARAHTTRMSVPVPPCPSFYDEACWGGPATLLAAWYHNISTAAQSTATAQSFQAVTAHHYRPTVAEINCTLGGSNCMYTAGHSYGIDGHGSTRGELSDADFASVMVTYPSVTLAAAAKAWRRDFPHKPLLITEFEMQWPNGPSPGATQTERFVLNAVDSGAHAVFYAAAIVAALDSAGTIGSINHHALGAGEPGWGLMDLSHGGGTGFNAVAQMMSHLSELATVQYPVAHRVNVTGNVTLGALVIDSVGSLPALQATALSGAAGLAVLVVNRAQHEVSADLLLPPEFAAVARGSKGEGRESTGRTVSYLASDRGGWRTIGAAEAAGPLPWKGPMRAVVSPLRAVEVRAGAGVVVKELLLPALSFTIVELKQ